MVMLSKLSVGRCDDPIQGYGGSGGARARGVADTQRPNLPQLCVDWSRRCSDDTSESASLSWHGALYPPPPPWAGK